MLCLLFFEGYVLLVYFSFACLCGFVLCYVRFVRVWVCCLFFLVIVDLFCFCCVLFCIVFLWVVCFDLVVTLGFYLL